MDRALPGDLHQLGVLFCAQRTSQVDFNVNPVEQALLRFAFLAILRVDTRVPE